MNLIELGKTIAKIGAPLLGTVLGGPAGGAIGQLVAAQFGGDIEKPEELIQKIQADPDAPVKLKQIESNEKVRLQELAVEMAEISFEHDTASDQTHQKDRESARNYQTETYKLGKRDWVPGFLVVSVVLGLFGVVAAIIFVQTESADKDILMMVVGLLVAKFGTLIDFNFGSSKT